ncbi:MAG: hypothetical protein AAF581_10985 [Planctomycetota bacterium]
MSVEVDWDSPEWNQKPERIDPQVIVDGGPYRIKIDEAKSTQSRRTGSSMLVLEFAVQDQPFSQHCREHCVITPKAIWKLREINTALGITMSGREHPNPAKYTGREFIGRLKFDKPYVDENGVERKPLKVDWETVQPVPQGHPAPTQQAPAQTPQQPAQGQWAQRPQAAPPTQPAPPQAHTGVATVADADVPF